MATRVGIELSPGACRIIEIDGGVTRSIDDVPETRVRSYAVLELGSAEMFAHLATLRRRSAAVVVWGIRSDHRQVIIEQSSYDKMRGEALASARQAAVETDGMLSDIAPAGPAQAGITRRPVLLAMGASRGIAAAVQPLLQAGLRLRSVVTPADALASLARTRYAFSPKGTIEAFVALEETATAVALVRDGGLIAARELPWGFLTETGGRKSRPREDIAARTADALSEFFAEIGLEPGSVRQISICGGLPELRSMTVQLMERLDVEVETLDSLFSIDSEHLPAPEQDFRDRSAELRLAWAVTADWVAPINLIRHRKRDQTRRTIARAAVIAGVAAGLGLGWRIQTSQWWQTTAPMMARATPPRPTTTATKTVARLEEPRPPLGVTAPAPPTAIASAESGRGGELAQPPPGAAKTVAAPPVPTPQTNATPPLSAAAVPPAPLPPKTTPSAAPVVAPALPPPKIMAPAAAAPPVLPPAANPPAPAHSVPTPAPAPATSSSARANTPAPLPPKVAPAAAAKGTSGPGSTSAPTPAPAANVSGKTSAAVAPPRSGPSKVTLPPTAAPTTTPAIASVKPAVAGPSAPAAAVPATSSARDHPSPAPRAVDPAPRAATAISAPRTAEAAAKPAPAAPARASGAPPRAIAPPPPRAAEAAPRPGPTASEALPRTIPPETPASVRAGAIPPAPRAAEAPPAPEPAPRVPEPARRLVPPAAPVVAPPRATAPPSRTQESAARVPPPAVLPRQEPPPRAAVRQQTATQPPLPLDAVLGTILYSPERKLAIVDGRIVSVGDEVKGAIIVDITPNTVLLRDGQGRMRSLTLGGLGR